MCHAPRPVQRRPGTLASVLCLALPRFLLGLLAIAFRGNLPQSLSHGARCDAADAADGGAEQGVVDLVQLALETHAADPLVVRWRRSAAPCALGTPPAP